MTKWTIRRDEPYENSEEWDFPDAQAAIDALKRTSEWGRRYLNIFPTPEVTYEPREFEAAFAKGEVE